MIGCHTGALLEPCIVQLTLLEVYVYVQVNLKYYDITF